MANLKEDKKEKTGLVRMDKELHKKLKVKLALDDLSYQDFALECIKKYVNEELEIEK
mgnify:FL=1